MPAAARQTDFHSCPMQTPGVPPIPHVGGPVSQGVPTVLIGGLPAATVGSMCVCVGPPDSIVKGSSSVMIGGMQQQEWEIRLPMGDRWFLDYQL